MSQHMQRLLTRLLPLIMAGSIYATDAESLPYDKPVSLTGTIVREYDMSFVDSDLGPIQDPKEVTRAVAEARRKHPTKKSKPQEPSPHFILRLEKPISVRAESRDEFRPAERNISEIDLGGSVHGVTEQELSKTLFVVAGTLSHAMTVHHLRPITMKVITLKRAR